MEITKKIGELKVDDVVLPGRTDRVKTNRIVTSIQRAKATGYVVVTFKAQDGSPLGERARTSGQADGYLTFRVEV